MQLVFKELPELRGTLKSGLKSNICTSENTKALCLKRLLKDDVCSLFQIILHPHTDDSSFSSGVIKERTG